MILIIDFGSQYNQLIARRVRECHIYCQIEPPGIAIDYIKSLNPDGIILSGGPSSIYEKQSPKIDTAIFNMKIPILGICYGMQFMIYSMGGIVKRAEKREYGFAEFNIKYTGDLFTKVNTPAKCWMSHGDSIDKLPGSFKITASTLNTKIAAIEHKKKKLYGLQFHPEVEHTTHGKTIIRNFLFKICGCRRSWTMKSFARDAVSQIKETIKDKKVILGLSGGVDSSVTALLLHRAVGKNLTCIFVDNGLLRKNEADKLKKTLKFNLKINIRFVNAKNMFLKPLANIIDPEKKRKIIVNIFL